MDLFELTRKLIDVPSVTGYEGEVGKFLELYLKSLGYEVQPQRITDDRFNVFAMAGTPRVVFSTHMDTVPPHIGSSEDHDYIYGRGACDAKGIIAAQIQAAENLRHKGLTDIGLLFTVDEEMGSLGAQLANKDAAAKASCYLINGEPTDNKLASGTKGSLRCLLSTSGRSAHSAYPEQGSSAIDALLDVLESIRECQWPVDEEFGDTTCNIGVIAGGRRPNVIADEARAELQIRLATGVAPVRELLDCAIAGRANIEIQSAHEPIRLHIVPGIEQCVVRFTTDIPYLSNWGKALLIGPGSILDAHTDHERVRKDELLTAVELYASLGEQLYAASC